MPYKLTSGGVLSASSLARCAALKRFPKGLVGLGEWFYRIPRHSLRYFKSLAEMPNNSLLTWAREWLQACSDFNEVRMSPSPKPLGDDELGQVAVSQLKNPLDISIPNPHDPLSFHSETHFCIRSWAGVEAPPYIWEARAPASVVCLHGCLCFILPEGLFRHQEVVGPV